MLSKLASASRHSDLTISCIVSQGEVIEYLTFVFRVLHWSQALLRLRGWNALLAVIPFGLFCSGRTLSIERGDARPETSSATAGTTTLGRTSVVAAAELGPAPMYPEGSPVTSAVCIGCRLCC